MPWRSPQLRFCRFLLWFPVLAAFSCSEDPAACVETVKQPLGLTPGQPNIAQLPTASCLTDEQVSADYPDHLQLSLDGVLTQLESIDMPATLDTQSTSLWLALRSIPFQPERKQQEPLDEYELRIELDATGLPEGETQVVQLDLSVSGSFNEPLNVRYEPGPRNSSLVHRLDLRSFGGPEFDYHADGTLRLSRTAGRVRGTLDVNLTGVGIVKHSLSANGRVGIVACFDAPVALRFQESDPTVCGVDQVDLTDIADCGRQGMLRPFSCSQLFYLDTARVEAITNCVRDKLASGEPFHVRVEMPGFDTDSRVLWVQSTDGVLTRYHSYRNTPWLSARRCSMPRIAAPAPEGVQDELIDCAAQYGEWMVCADDDIFHDP